jgi:glucosamine 6-phosphate synthetase-like amidotransferase/phosphosugar isomerase protein
MCGIISIVSKTSSGFSFKEKQMFSQMLYTNALRGFDSTGTFCINKYGNVQLIKSAQPAELLLLQKPMIHS